ncbi:MAG: hypothetical protein Q4B04_03000 [bacterium]|nr:hypothetical protein [bacterium]
MNIRKFLPRLVLFGIGSVGYGLIELLWRGYTHPSMLLAGGICFYTITIISNRLANLNVLYKCAVSSLIITTVELVFGCVFNLLLKCDVWDYSHIPFNLKGQICLLFSLLWGLLSLALFPICKLCRNKLL